MNISKFGIAQRAVVLPMISVYASLCAYQLNHQNKPTIQIMESLA